MKSTHSLASVVAAWTAGVIAVAMGAFAALQYLLRGGIDPLHLAISHGWHVAVLSAVTYLVVLLVLRRLVVRPIRQIGSQLYRIGTGRVQPIQVNPGVTEIAALQQGVNRMVQRMELAGWKADGKSNSLFPYEQMPPPSSEVRASR